MPKARSFKKCEMIREKCNVGLVSERLGSESVNMEWEITELWTEFRWWVWKRMVTEGDHQRLGTGWAYSSKYKKQHPTLCEKIETNSG